MSKVKIFIASHNKQKVIKSDIIETMQVGRAISNEIYDGMIGDDTKDNISNLNPKYNELTAQYWVWKNYEAAGNPDYIGFMHYRRHFVFDENLDYKNNTQWFFEMKFYEVPAMSQKYLDNLKDENIKKVVSGNYDCYIIQPYDINYMHNNDLYMKEHYISTILGAKRFIWNIFIDTIKNLYPDYSQLCDEFAYGHKLVPCNMYIMKKDLFNQYCKFCFDVLKQVDLKVNSENFSAQEKRFLGFLGEYLLTIFVMKLQKNNYKIKYMDGLLFLDMQTGKNKKQTFWQNIFSIKSAGDIGYKILTVCFIKLKIKIKPSEISLLRHQLNSQQDMIKMLLDKVTELQEQVILKK